MEDMQREYWNDLAGPKWVASQAQLDETLAPFADALRPVLRGVGEGACIVDVGCGCGATTLMAHRCAPGAEIIGIDVSEPMLERAMDRAELLRTQHIRFVNGDAGDQDLPAESVDHIISRFGVMFFAEPARAFGHMRRWLKPKGRMTLVVWAPRADNPWMTGAMAALAKHIDLPPPDPDAPGPFALGDAEKRAAIFQKAGLLVESEDALEHAIRVRGSVDEVTAFYAERGPASLALQNASEDARNAAVDALREFVEANHDGRGSSLPGKALRLTLTVDPNAPEPEPEPEASAEGEDDAGAAAAEGGEETSEASAAATSEGEPGASAPPEAAENEGSADAESEDEPRS